MKRSVLLGFASIYILALSAQNPVVQRKHVFPVINKDIPVPVEKDPVVPVHAKKLAQSSNSVSIIDIGTGINAYGLSGNGRTCLWVDNATNTVAFFHRLAGSESLGSSIGVDISKAGGLNWVNNTLIYDPVGQPVPPLTYSEAAGRFPQGAIYNPYGNTNPNNTYAHYIVPTLDGSNPYAQGGWGGVGYGELKLDMSAPPSQQNISSGSGFLHNVPSAFTLQDTLVLMAEPLFAGSEFSDTMIVARGVWMNGQDYFNYTRQKISTPTDWKVKDTRIAFSPNGSVGYISILSHNSAKPLQDSTYYPILYKTTNGGQSWSGPLNVNLYGPSGIPEVKDYLTDGDLNFLFGFVPDRDLLRYTTIGDHDLVVDMNGNPHIGVVISLAQGSYETYVPSTCVVFDLYSLDGGINWHGAPLETIYNVWGTFGTGNLTITEDNRVQLSRSNDGSKVFVSWLDTYPANSPSNNIAPDIYVVGLNIENLTKTSVMNVTVGTPAQGMAYMAVQSHVVFAGPDQYTIPFVFQSMNPYNVDYDVQYKYIGDFVIDDSLFTTTYGTTLITYIKDASVVRGVIHMPVQVANCTGVAAISLSLEYNDSLLVYQGYENVHSNLSSGSLVVNAMNKHIQFSWYSIFPADIGNAVLCEFIFYALTGSSNLHWDCATQAACEYTNINSDIIPSTFIDGMFNIIDGRIQGTVTYANNQSTPLSNTNVTAKEGTTLVSADSTNTQGIYTVEDLESGTYIITAATDKAWGGSNSMDALNIQRYFAGYTTLSGIKLKAADVNASIGVNSVDALLIGRRFTMLINSFAAGDWYFIKDTVTLDSADATINLKGICIGDVNGSYIPAIKEGPPPSLLCKGMEENSTAGLMEIPFRVGREARIGSISYIMNFDPGQIRIRDVRMKEGGTLAFNVLPGQFRLSWFSLDPLVLQPGETMFTLLCEPVKMDGLCIPGFELEGGTVFSDENAEVLDDLQLNYPGIITGQEDMWLSQNHPNPFSLETRFSYYIPEDAMVSLSVYNILGERLYNGPLEGSAGIHQGYIPGDRFAPGVYSYELTAKSDSGTFRCGRKMMIAR